jgi:hypothetical protein
MTKDRTIVGRLPQHRDFNHKRSNTPKLDAPAIRMTAMKQLLLFVVPVALACAATLLPIRSTPPMLLSNTDGVEWKCSKLALVLTTCAPARLPGIRSSVS